MNATLVDACYYPLLKNCLCLFDNRNYRVAIATVSVFEVVESSTSSSGSCSSTSKLN